MQNKYSIIMKDLDVSEASHITEIINDYRSNILMQQLKYMALKEIDTENWHKDHLSWHDTVLKKMKWINE